MKRRSLLLCLALALSIVTAIGGTLAYLTDTETTANVMSVGNVAITLFEQQRADQSTDSFEELEAYTNGQPLYPAVYTADADGMPVAKGTLWTSAEVAGAVDKIVSAKNDGASDAYYRFAFAFEKVEKDGQSMILVNRNEEDFTWTSAGDITLSDGASDVLYEVWVANPVNPVLAPQAVSPYSLYQVAMDERAGNDETAQLGEEYSILVAVQATQTQNFAGYEQAMKTSFGDITQENLPWTSYVPEPWDGKTAVTTWYSDDRTSFTLSSAEELAGLAQLVNRGKTFAGKTITLTHDLDLNDKAWTPIGAGRQTGASFVGVSFKGTFDGNGKTIKGLTILSSSFNNPRGLFGVVDGGTVRNLTLHTNTTNDNAELLGGAVGMLTGGGVVDRVTVNGSISAPRAGGVVGRIIVDGTVKNCTNNAAVTGKYAMVGGIVGSAEYTKTDKRMTITGCVNNGAVTGGSNIAWSASDDSCAAGGIVGLSAADVSFCTNTAAVTGDGSGVGGIVGEQFKAGSVRNCTNTADITNTGSFRSGTGGILGLVRYYNDLYTGSDIYSQCESVQVTGNTNTGSVLSKDGYDAGGIVGKVYNAAAVTDNVNKAATLKASYYAAGIVGSVVDTSSDSGIVNAVTVSNNISTTPKASIHAYYGTDLFVVKLVDYVTAENNRTTE